MRGLRIAMRRSEVDCQWAFRFAGLWPGFLFRVASRLDGSPEGSPSRLPSSVTGTADGRIHAPALPTGTVRVQRRVSDQRPDHGHQPAPQGRQEERRQAGHGHHRRDAHQYVKHLLMTHRQTCPETSHNHPGEQPLCRGRTSRVPRVSPRSGEVCLPSGSRLIAVVVPSATRWPRRSAGTPP